MLYALAAAAAAGVLLWLLLRKKKEPQPSDTRRSRSAAVDRLSEAELREKKSERLAEIAESVRFSVVPVVLKQVKVGEHFEDSPYPADGIDVRKAGGLSDLPRTLGTARMLPAPLQIMSLLTGRSMTMKHTVRVDELADVVGVPRNTLIVLQDVSTSMEDWDRYSWAVKLNKHLIARAEKGEADVRLIAFNEYVRSETIANDENSYARLKRNLSQLLFPGGGTDIDTALNAAFVGFEEAESDDRKLVLVTDGTCSVNIAHAKQRLSELSVELHVVCIGESNSSLEAIADRYDFFPD